MYPVTVRRCRIADGSWRHDDRLAKGRARARDSRLVGAVAEAQLLVLWHEFGHALQWRPDAAELSREHEHDAEWGVALARIWREIIG